MHTFGVIFFTVLANALIFVAGYFFGRHTAYRAMCNKAHEDMRYFILRKHLLGWSSDRIIAAMKVMCDN